MNLGVAERLRMLARMDIDVYLPRSVPGEMASKMPAAACILICLDRPKAALDIAQKHMLSNLLKALQWNGAFRQDAPQGDRAVLEIAFGVPGSGQAEVTIETDTVERLVVDKACKQVLWARLKAELPRLRSLES